MQRPLQWFGESALLVEPFGGEDVHELSKALGDLSGVEDVVPGHRVLVRVAPELSDEIQPLLRALHSIPFREGTHRLERTVEIPVTFDGPDLGEVASKANMTESEAIQAVVGAPLVVAHLGFAPGFAYVTGLPAALSDIERRPVPRASVPAGSVGIAGGYLGVYPQASPGGWNLIGRTGTVMFDPEVAPYSALQPGDRLRLVATKNVGSPPESATPKIRPKCTSSRRLVVVNPGALTTLQDGGRRNVAHLGVPRAGPVDRDMAHLANLLVGNDAVAGLLEITIEGPVLRFDAPAHAVVVGAGVELDGRRMESGAVFEIGAGERVGAGASSGLRGYLAVAGGITGPELFGSCSSDLLAGLGIGALQAGDELGFGEGSRMRGYSAELERHRSIRVLAGPEQIDNDDDDDDDDDDATALRAWLSGTFEVSSQTNRVGVRLSGAGPPESELGLDLSTRNRPSFGMVPGALQVPPSGEPIVLLCDHATMGGYPVLATVISADLGVLAQRRPGETVQFEVVDQTTARAARTALDRQLARAPTGHFPASPV